MVAPVDPPDVVYQLDAPVAPAVAPVVEWALAPALAEWAGAGVVQAEFVQERDPVNATELWLARKASTPRRPATSNRATAARALHCWPGDRPVSAGTYAAKGS